MNTGTIQDRQRAAYADLVGKKIPETVHGHSLTLDGVYGVNFEVLPISSDFTVTENDTDFVPVKAKCTLENKITWEKIDFNVDLLNLPVFQSLGFRINGNYMQTLDLYERTTGWSFTFKSDGNGVTQRSASLMALNGASLAFLCDERDIPLVKLKSGRLASEKQNLPVSIFFRAITGMSNEELLGMFGYDNPYVIASFNTYGKVSSYAVEFAQTRNDCIEMLADAMLGKSVSAKYTNISLKQREIENRLFSRDYMNLGRSSHNRLEYSQSFMYRASGKLLAEDVSVNGYEFKDGEILNNETLEILDSLPLTSLSVRHNGKVYKLRKFSTFTFRALGYVLAEELLDFGLTIGTVLGLQELRVLNASGLTVLRVKPKMSGAGVIELRRRTDNSVLTVDDIFTAFSIWMDNLNGYDAYDKVYELTNRVVQPYDVTVLNIIDSNLSKIVRQLSEKLKLLDLDDSMINAIPDFSKSIDLYEFINSIKNTQGKSGQLSDMCNVLGFTSKDYKITSTINAKSITGDLIEVQDLQEGRLDPFDTPESDKIGIVHNRCIMTKVDDDGYMTSPYLEVHNGKAGTEPVYLTATEESGKYIAEWSETFVNEDGSPKDAVKVRCNGEVTYVPVSKVSYKEFSPYQNMSAVHATIPFPGHSNGKRITMGCNQPKQAVPLVKRERPLVNAGGESLIDFGTYYARDILRRYYDNLVAVNPDAAKHKKEFLASTLELTKIDSDDGIRTLTFKVTAASKLNREQGLKLKDFTELSFPYLLKNNETCMFSYDINHVGGVYKPDDVVAYNNGMSLKDPGHLMFMDTGAQQISEQVFNKGLALMKNILCVYKTWEGSTIDDAITLSSRMVYDDELTSVSLMTVSMTLHESDNSREEFARADDEYKYFDSSGLPAIGTVLHAGDPAICKVITDGTKQTVKYKYLNQYTSGQVVSAKIGIKNNEKVAEVILAERSQIEVGDKLSGRVGNKGVIAKIVPYWEMPVIEDTGEVVDIILNPLGIPSRQNITQLLIAALSYCVKQDNKLAFVSPYHPGDVDFVREQMRLHNVKPSRLIDGRTGQFFERPVNYGILSMYKLHHMARKKIHAIGMNTSVDPVFLQPRKGSKMNGGQSFGEMESWCLEAIGAKKILQDLYSVQSNDVTSLHSAKKALEFGRQVDFSGNNHNDVAIKACFQSMGLQMVSDTENQEYRFVPMKDSVIRSLSMIPVENANSLHSSQIFGESSSHRKGQDNADKWGWLELHTKMISPLWIEKGSLGKLIWAQDSGFLSNSDFKNIIQGKLFVVCDDSMGACPRIYKEDGMPSDKFVPVSCVPDNLKLNLKTGMPALSWVFEHASINAAEEFCREMCLKCREKIEKTDTSGKGLDNKKYKELLKHLNLICEFKKSGASLADYVITSFPVMPQMFRPVLHNTNVKTTPDFDWHYSQILRAAEAVRVTGSNGSIIDLYERIQEFIGFGKTDRKAKYQNLLNYFAGKDKSDDHGKIRSAVQSKKILCSGRAAIIPSSDITMRPTQIGIPITAAVKIWESQLIGFFRKQLQEPCPCGNSAWTHLLLVLAGKDYERFSSLYRSKFEKYFHLGVIDAYEAMRQWIYDCVEGEDPVITGEVCIAGRQPTLHKYGIRGYRVKLVESKVINIHPLVCKGYNADFDGDQMWFSGLISVQAKEEALEKMSAVQDIINPKNSKVMLEHSQDIALGIYCATMLKDNAASLDYRPEDVLGYSSLERIGSDLDAGIIKPYQLVTVRHEGHNYFSTAGRVVFNCAITNGFTENAYSDPFHIDGSPYKDFCDLRFDGLITSGNGGRDSVVYYNLQDICMQLYNEQGSECLEDYQSISEFGFTQADRCGVSLSLYDLDIKTDKKGIIKDMNDLKFAIEQDFLDGLIAPEDKAAAVLSLYTDKRDGAAVKIQKDLMSNIDRSNNLFIMMDSGARGNETQMMHMCGSVGVLQKTKVRDLEDAVTANYYEGLGSFDVHMASYSTRTGVASTQNETRKAGYATRQVVYMTGGVEIVAEDCGKSDWWFDIVWNNRIEELDKFTPSVEWFNANLLGRAIDASDMDAIHCFGVKEDRMITSDCAFFLSMNGGFHSVLFEDGSKISISMDSMKGLQLLPSDETAMRYAKKLLRDGKITAEAIKAFERKFIKQVMTESGTFTFRYKMDKGCSSMLLNREATNLKGLARVHDTTFGKDISVITKDTIKFIEEEGLDRIQARVLLDCKCKHGICAHCYGLEYSKPLLPEIGSFVGVEAAQAAGEPAAQLTISLINKGGAAGESIASGVAVFDGLLHGGAVGGANASTALVAPVNGYVEIKKLDEQVAVSIVPEDKECSLCQRCKKMLKVPWCPKEKGVHASVKKDPLCLIPKRLLSKSVLPQDGEWMYSGEYLTDNILVPNNSSSTILLADTIQSVNDDTSPEVVLRKKQMIWLLNYFHTFLSNNITINARHFEIFSRVQNQYVTVLDSSIPEIAPGSVHEINEVLPYGDAVTFSMGTSKISDVTLLNSGAYTALSFENIASVAANLAVSCHKSSFKHNNALIGCLSIGSDVEHGEMKKLKNPEEIVRDVPGIDVAEESSDVILVEETASASVSGMTLEELLSGTDFAGLSGDTSVGEEGLSTLSAFNGPASETEVSKGTEVNETTVNELPWREEEFDAGKGVSILSAFDEPFAETKKDTDTVGSPPWEKEDFGADGEAPVLSSLENTEEEILEDMQEEEDDGYSYHLSNFIEGNESYIGMTDAVTGSGSANQMPMDNSAFSSNTMEKDGNTMSGDVSSLSVF